MIKPLVLHSVGSLTTLSVAALVIMGIDNDPGRKHQTPLLHLVASRLSDWFRNSLIYKKLTFLEKSTFLKIKDF